ncbi:SCP domain-containing protein [Mycena sanguinolenta]|uniref:SCP domain-containing protein n=1 Tax=Mycena sanguinolenta TaxID=230812 RepID=A0A8H6Y7B4_9AGAR|nr:SCP domain-containing protein [Mycena sanguinolenta]
MLFLFVLAFASVVGALATPKERFLDSRNGHAHVAKSLLFPSDADLYLDSHNEVRVFHGAAHLVWNDTLADAASGWAQTCQISHSDGTLLNGTPYGENIVAGTGHFPIATAMNQFTLDESDYTSGSEVLNHFTQVVWQSTTQLGCAVASCDGIFDPSLGSASYYVCLYYPAGNVIGQAAVNVQA